MSFYDPGTSTPNLAGLVQTALLIGSDPFRINDGTFELHSCGRLVSSAPLRTGVATLPADHGASTGTPLYTEFPFEIVGRLSVPALSDIWDAYDLLLEAFNLDTGLLTLTLNTSGWSAARQMGVLVAGQVQIIEPLELAKLVPDRDFTVPLVAPDPRLYSLAEHTQAIGSSTVISNAGTASTPLKVVFNGPQTDPELDGPGLTGRKVRYSGSIASGHSVTVDMNSTGAGPEAWPDSSTSTSVWSSLSDTTGRSIPPGSSAWAASNTTGAGTTELHWRDAWL